MFKTKACIKTVLLLAVLIFSATTIQLKANYCYPSFENGCEEGDLVTSFSIANTGYSFSNMTCNPGFQSKNVSDIIQPETNYEMNFSVDYSYQNLKIFVDWNKDGQFDHEYSEIWDGYCEDYSLQATLNIPADKFVKSGKFRVMVINIYGDEAEGPCDDYEYSFGAWFSFDAWFGSTEPDAAISNIIGPENPFRVGVYDVYAELHNASEMVDLESAYINWWFNGVKQEEILWEGLLEPDEKAEIFLANINFDYPQDAPFNPFLFEVRVSNPNEIGFGEEDASPNNDFRSKSFTPILNDAGVTEFLNPFGNYGTGLQEVIVIIQNFAPRPLSSVTVRWDVDGVQQPDFYWTGNLDFNETAEVVIGKYDIYIKSPLAPFDFNVRTVNPNGVTDQYQQNDAITFSTAPALVPGTYTVGGDKATFASPEALADYLNASGIIGDGDVTFVINSGTYNGQVLFDNFTRGNNNFYFRSASSNANDVKLQFTPNAGANYVLAINQMDNFHFSNLTFVTQNNSAYGTIVHLNETQNISFDNIVFQGQYNPNGMEYNNVALNAYGSNIITVNNSRFNGNAIGILNVSNRNLYDQIFKVTNCHFTDFSVSGVLNTYESGYAAHSQPDIVISNNEFRAGSNYNPNNGIQSIPGSVISNNLFNGFNGTGGTIIRIHGDMNYQSLISQNTVNNTHGVSGISIEGGNAEVFDNAITLDNESNIANTAALRVHNTSGGTSKLYSNSLMARNTMGVDLNNANVELWQTRIHSTGSQAIISSNNSSGFISNNHLTGATNVDGIQLMNSNGMHVIYNSLYTFSTGAALHVAGSGVAKVFRNIFVNGGPGVALIGTNVDRSTLELDYNNYFTFSEPFAKWDVTNIADFNGWKAISLKGEHSSAINPEFNSPTDLRLTRHLPVLAHSGELDLNLSAEQRDYYESLDYYGKTRGENDTYYSGIDQIKPEIEVSIHPSSVTACQYTTSAFMSVSVSMSLGTKAHYQWYKDGEKIPGATKSIINFDDYSSIKGVDFNQAAVYSVEIGAEGGITTVWANPAALYVVGDTEIIRNPQDAFAEVGGIATFEVKAHAKFLPPNHKFDYQWYRYNKSSDRVEPLANNNIYSGVHTNILAINVNSEALYTNNSDYYFVEIRGLCGLVVSEHAQLNEKKVFGVEIVEQPAGQDACAGEAITLSVNARGMGSTTTINYQWYANGTALKDGNNVTGSRSATLVISNIQKANAGTYYAIAFDANSTENARSNNATVAVANPPVFTMEFEDQSINTGDALILIFTAEGDDLTYQLFHNDEFVTGGNEASQMFVYDAGYGNREGEWKLVVSNDCGSIETISNITVSTGGTVSYNESVFFDDVAPNPAISELTMRFYTEQIGATQIKVRDLTGAELFSITHNSNVGENAVHINVSNLNSGVYFIELQKGKHVQTKKFVISR